MAPGATTKKNKKNKEKTSVKYIALPATVPSGLKNGNILGNVTQERMTVN